MSNGIQDHFKRLQELSNQINGPYQKMVESILRINRASFPIFTDDVIKQSFSPIIESSLNQQRVIKQILINESFSPLVAQLKQVQESFSRLASIQNHHLTVPSVIYPELERLITKVYDDIPFEDNSDLESTITVRNTSQSQIDKKQLNWNQLFQILFIIYQILYPLYSDYSSNLQSERHHQEQLILNEKHKNEILTQDQKQHVELLEQNERHHQELLEQNERHHNESKEQSELEHDEQIEAFSNFMEFIAPYLPDDQDTTESESEDPVTLG